MFDLTACVAAVRAVAGQDRSGWSGAARTAVVRELAVLRQAVDAAWVGAVADWDRDRSWAAEGAASATAWLAHHTGATRGEAAASVAAGRLVRRHERVRDALDAGTVDAGHVVLMARAARDREPLFERDVDVLLDAATHLGVEPFRTVARRWCALADDHTTGPASDGGPARWLHVSATFSGHVRVDGLLDPDGGGVLLAALDALSPPPAPDDPRTAAERRADALVAAVGGARPSVTLDVVVDASTLTGTTSTGAGGRRHDLHRVGPVAPTLVERYACDATIRRVLLDPDGAPVEVGPATRVVPPSLRRLLVHRDGGCTWPGCDRPPEWCDAHHVVPWTSGGATAAGNLTLLCRHHHRLVHQGRRPPPEPPEP